MLLSGPLRSLRDLYEANALLRRRSNFRSCSPTEAYAVRVLARLLSLTLVVAALGGGFLYGHALGAHGQGKDARQRVGRLFPFSKPEPTESDAANQQADESVPPVNVYEDVLDHVQKEFVENNGTSNARLSNGSLAR